MKHLIPVFIFLIAPFFLHLQAQTSSRVKILIDPQSLSTLIEHGIPVDEGIDQGGKSLTTDLYDYEIISLINDGVICETLIPDVASYYKNRYLESINNAEFKELLKIQNTAYQVPSHFYLGSMGGFYTWEQIQNQLDSMVLLYPNLIKAKQPISSTNSIENRPIYWLKISDNPNIDEQEPEILYTALHHAREPISVQSMIYFMWYLLENYNNDTIIKHIIDNTELYFVPVINPDGFCYNQQTNPYGGGNWRKNRRNTGSDYGIDLNRNYGYMWGIDDTGSSPDPGEETYRGSAAFSEPEIQNIRDFCISRQFKLCLNYHSYANKLLYAWNYQDTDPLTVDDNIFSEYAKLLTHENHFIYGAGAQIMYLANGGSDDWMYGEQTTKPKIFAYTSEVGTVYDGFWPDPVNIIPLCNNTMWQNIHAALLFLKYATVEDKSTFNLPDIFGYIKYDIKNLGLDNPSDFELSVIPVTTNLFVTGGPVTYSNLQYMETRHDSLYYVLSNLIQPGDPVTYILKLSDGIVSYYDTVTRIFGAINVSYIDSCNDLSGWTGGWNITGDSYHSPMFSITDSPGGDYTSNEENSLTSNTYNIPSNTPVFLSYWAKWDIEAGYDYVQLKISTNNGSTWTPLEGQYTHSGTLYQSYNKPVYDGQQPDWVEEFINLDPFTGQSVKFRFTLASDEYSEYDGFYFDDFRIFNLTTGTGINENHQPVFNLNAVPNPSHDICTIYFDNNTGGDAVLEVSDINGKIIYTKPVSLQSGKTEVPVNKWKPGIYVYKIICNGVRSEAGKLIVIPD